MFDNHDLFSNHDTSADQIICVTEDEIEILDLNEAFFPPVSTDAIDRLVAEFDGQKQAIYQAAELAKGASFQSAMWHFLDGNAEAETRSSMKNLTKQLFSEEGAINSLTQMYWEKAIELTGVRDHMPQKRRDEWHESLTSWRTQSRRRHGDEEQSTPKMPPFEADTVRSSLYGLLDMRAQFLSEKVDGIFRNLSREHVTNQPEGFSKRLIIWYNHNRDWITTDWKLCGYLDDLRSVISKFMGGDDVKFNSSSSAVDTLIKQNRFSEWVNLDGNALRLKIFKKGTAHLEVHPDIAYRLNMILAQMHPLVIPSKFREKPDRTTAKNFGLMQRPLPNDVIRALSIILRQDNKYRTGVPCVFECGSTVFRSSPDLSRFAIDEAIKILAQLGGVLDGEQIHFEYDVIDLFNTEISFNRCVPETKSHQFYPTPETLATKLADLAAIRPGESVLEPSAGVGALINHLPDDYKRNVTCFEVAKLHCEILRKKGFTKVYCEDFLSVGKTTSQKWDVVLMNPPFSDGRAMDHLTTAISLLKEGGRLFAILPASVRHKVSEPGCKVEYSEIMNNAFPGVSVSVVIVSIVKNAMAMAA